MLLVAIVTLIVFFILIIFLALACMEQRRMLHKLANEINRLSIKNSSSDDTQNK